MPQKAEQLQNQLYLNDELRNILNILGMKLPVEKLQQFKYIKVIVKCKVCGKRTEQYVKMVKYSNGLWKMEDIVTISEIPTHCFPLENFPIYWVYCPELKKTISELQSGEEFDRYRNILQESLS